jgi:acetyltransferase-like isoleucine patch superfamily enzyme
MVFLNKKNSDLKFLINKVVWRIYSRFERLKWVSYYLTIQNSFNSLGDNVVIDYGVWFGGPKNISIGDNVFIGRGAIINASKGGHIYLGDGCAIGANTTIVTWNLDNLNNRGLIRSENKKIFKNVTIGMGVGVGYNVTINPGVILGDGCEVAASSVVTRDINPYEIVSGNPAVVIGIRRVAGNDVEKQ